MPGRGFYPQSRAEHLIALGRMILSAFFLLAIYLDPSEPSRYAQQTYAILLGYSAYSLVLGKALWRRPLIPGYLQILTHSVDLSVFATLMFLTAGPNSPFFVYFIFLLVCATFRWQWRGTLLTAGAALAVVLALAWYPANLLHDESFELNRFIIRIVYLAVVAVLLGYLGAHEQAMRKVFLKLASWPRSIPHRLQPMLEELLPHAAAVLGAPRVLLVWEEEEPWLHVAFWAKAGLSYSCESPSLFGSVVAEQFLGTSFFCQDAGASLSPVVQDSPAGLVRWQGTPLQAQLRERYGIGAVLASRLQGEEVSGYLLALDKEGMTADDLVLGGIVAHEVASRLDHHLLLKRLQISAASEERIRLARDLHDGLLQSLSGAALQLESAQRLLETDPVTARQRIKEIQQLLAVEQRDLRSHIVELRPFLPGRAADDYQLSARLRELAERIRRQWDLSVDVTMVPARPLLTRGVAKEIYFVVHEALINAVRHAGASTLCAELSFGQGRAHITLTDNGHGFSFRGRYDGEALLAMKRGPVTLRERVAALGGTLVIDSQDTGARLEIVLPISEQGD